MKKFVIKSIFFVGLMYASIFVYIEYFAMGFSYMDYPIYKAQIDYINNGPTAFTPDVLILGDSRSLTGIVPTKISEKGRSMGLTGGTSVTVYYALKHYLEKFQTPQMIILSISPLLFEKFPEFYSRSIKYRLLSTADAWEVIKRAQELNDFPFEVTPASGSYYWEWFLYRANYLLYYKDEILAGRFYKMWRSNHDLYTSLGNAAGFWRLSDGAPSHGLNLETGRSTFVASPLLKDYLEKIIDLCGEKRIRVIFQAMPMNEASFKALKPAYILGYHDFMNGIQQQYKDRGLQMNFELFSFPDEYFGDPSHLNSKGAEIISEKIKKLL